MQQEQPLISAPASLLIQLPDAIWHRVVQLLAPCDRKSLTLTCSATRSLVASTAITKLNVIVRPASQPPCPTSVLTNALSSVRHLSLILTPCGPLVFSSRPNLQAFLSSFTQRYSPVLEHLTTLNLNLSSDIYVQLGPELRQLLSSCSSLSRLDLSIISNHLGIDRWYILEEQRPGEGVQHLNLINVTLDDDTAVRTCLAQITGNYDDVLEDAALDKLLFSSPTFRSCLRFLSLHQLDSAVLDSAAAEAHMGFLSLLFNQLGSASSELQLPVLREAAFDLQALTLPLGRFTMLTKLELTLRDPRNRDLRYRERPMSPHTCPLADVASIAGLQELRIENRSRHPLVFPADMSALTRLSSLYLEGCHVPPSNSFQQLPSLLHLQLVTPQAAGISG